MSKTPQQDGCMYAFVLIVGIGAATLGGLGWGLVEAIRVIF